MKKFSFALLMVLATALLLAGCGIGGGQLPDPADSLPAPVLIEPKNNALAIAEDLIFEWYAIAGVTRYTLEIKNRADDSVAAKVNYTTENRCDNVSCKVPSPVELAPGEYKWHVVAWVGEIRGQWSKYANLTIE
jgi:predicted small lipoprotein YifL